MSAVCEPPRAEEAREGATAPPRRRPQPWPFISSHKLDSDAELLADIALLV